MRRNIFLFSRMHFGIDLGRSTGQALVSAISASSPSMAPGPAVPIATRSPSCSRYSTMLPADHDIGRVGGIFLAVELAVGQQHWFGAEGQQTQLLLREALEEPHAGQDADVVIQRHYVPDRSA